jgi:hypothetical protein
VLVVYLKKGRLFLLRATTCTLHGMMLKLGVDQVRPVCICRWLKFVSLTRSQAKSLQRRRYRYLLHRIVTTGHHGPHPAAIIDTESGGVLAMLPPVPGGYAASQAVAPAAKLVQDIPTGTVHDERS